VKALSIRQPWAYLIVEGIKDIENRDWPTRLRGPIAIHAGKARPTEEQLAEIEAEHGIQIDRSKLLFGGFIGVATITDCVRHSDSEWFCGEFGFVLSDVRKTRFREGNGKLGFFDCPDLLPE